MKQKTNKKSLLNVLFAIIAFGLLALVPTGCQSDFEEVGQAKTDAKNFKTTIVSLNQITNGQKEIKNFIKATNAKALNSRGSIPGAKFDDANIMQATDDKGNINYSTKFSYVNDPENVFYNFVVNVLANGLKKSYIFKYICDPQYFPKYKYSNYDYNNFVGITEMKSYVEPPIDTNPNSNNKRSCDCEPVLIPSPGTNASNNGGGGFGGSNPGVSIAPGTNTTIIGYTVNSYSPGVTSVSWGGNTTYAGSGTTSGSCHGSCISMSGGLFIFQFGEIINPHQHKVANPKQDRVYNPCCNEYTTPVGLVPVNNIITAGQELTRILNLTRAQSRGFGGGYLAVDMLKYVLSHWSTEGFTFAKEMIDLTISLKIDVLEVHNSLPKYRTQMSSQELSIFDSLDKITQIRYLACGKKAIDTAKELFPNTIIGSNLYNGKGDAFRHAYWNGLSSYYIGTSLTEQLTNAHENRPINPNNPFEYKEVEMDLYNNSMGRLIASYSNLITFKDNLLSRLNLGDLRYLNNLGLDTFYPTIYSQLIPTNQ
jgi:hypothetical protein